MTMEQAQCARAFADLHKPGEPLLLPNAWDVASAVAIASAGAKAIATTSAGVAWSLGVPDGADLGADRAAAVVARIVAAVDVPVSADIEAGYEDVAATVTAVLQAGAVGVNIEDRRDGSGLYAPAEQADRLGARRAAPAAVRIILGSAIAQAAYAVAVRAATELLTSGTYDSVAGGIAYDTMNDAITTAVRELICPASTARPSEGRLAGRRRRAAARRRRARSRHGNGRRAGSPGGAARGSPRPGWS